MSSVSKVLMRYFAFFFPYQVHGILCGFYAPSPTQSEPSGCSPATWAQGILHSSGLHCLRGHEIPPIGCRWCQGKGAAYSGCLQAIFMHWLCQGQFPGFPSYLISTFCSKRKNRIQPPKLQQRGLICLLEKTISFPGIS